MILCGIGEQSRMPQLITRHCRQYLLSDMLRVLASDERFGSYQSHKTVYKLQSRDVEGTDVSRLPNTRSCLKFTRWKKRL